MNQKKKGWEGRSPGALPNKRKGKKGCRSKIKKKDLRDQDPVLRTWRVFHPRGTNSKTV